MGYFFVPCPLGSLRRVPGDVFGHAKLIETFRNIFSGSKTRLFPPWGYGQFCQKWPNFAQFWNILKFAFFTRLSPFGPQGVENITWESFLSTNNALRKFFRFDLKVQKSDFILCGLFLCPLSLGKPKTCPGMFSDTLNWLRPLTGIFFRGPKLDFFLRGGTGNFAKNDQILHNLEKFWSLHFSLV